MRKILTLSALAMLIAAPAFALSSDNEIRVQEEWQQLVEQVNAKRAAAAAAEMPATTATLAASKATESTATDGMPAGKLQQPRVAEDRPYSTTLSILQDK